MKEGRCGGWAGKVHFQVGSGKDSPRKVTGSADVKGVM